MSPLVSLLTLLALVTSGTLLADEKKSPRFTFEAFYGRSSVSPTDLNAARSQFFWNDVAPASGTFNNLAYYGAAVGYRLSRFFRFSLRAELQKQTLPSTDTGNGTTVTDSFLYLPLIAMLEIPISVRRWTLTLGGGAGYALNYEFHEQFTGTGEDITYKANPTVLRGRVSLGFALTRYLGIFAEGVYDRVSATKLVAAQTYQATVNGQPIASGQSYSGASGAAKVDMSGLRYALGLRLSL